MLFLNRKSRRQTFAHEMTLKKNFVKSYLPREKYIYVYVKKHETNYLFIYYL